MRLSKIRRTKSFTLQDFPKVMMGSPFVTTFDDRLFSSGVVRPTAGLVLGLISTISVATKIAKIAKSYNLDIYNTSRAEALLRRLDSAGKAALLLLDFEGCEAEAFKLLETFRSRPKETLKMPVFGFVSQGKRALKEEAEKAGCDRVFFKTEFLSDLENILSRSAL